MIRKAQRFVVSLPFLGLMFGTLAFCASLTPSLLPRTALYQGLLSGVSIAAGYGVGVFRLWLWEFLELPKPGTRLARRSKTLVAIALAGLCAYVLWRATDWQNSIRVLMDMPTLSSARPWQVLLIASVTALLIITISRLLRVAAKMIAMQVNRFMPRRISIAVGFIATAALFVLLLSGVLGRVALDAADASARQFDRIVERGIEQPKTPSATGGPESLVPWDSIGYQGKRFLSQQPSAEQIQTFHERRAITPLRIYVGLRSAKSPEARAKLALDELKRVRAFERSVLVVATPTGTGWLDPGAVDTLEYLHAGDTAIVATQYSYLPSWQTLIVDPERSRVEARALFNVIYEYWTGLERDKRPKLYLFGLSLGSLGSEASSELYLIFEDPIQGALRVGPPFPSTTWPSVTKARNQGSPYWSPRFRDGSLIRFTTQNNTLDLGGARWGPLRIVYLQHASDPMSFFSHELLWREPAWLSESRGPDVSPSMTWYPIVTFLQVAFDLPMASSVPTGFGHNFAAENYIDSWIAVTEPLDWSPKQTLALKAYFKERPVIVD